jgi:hypothetical protein
MQQHLLFEDGLAEIEHRQRERQEDDGAEGAQPVLLGAAQQQIELFQPVPDEGADDEKQGQTQDDVDGPEPGNGAPPLLSPISQAISWCRLISAPGHGPAPAGAAAPGPPERAPVWLA